MTLDSGPLGLLARPQGLPLADACRVWVKAIRAKMIVVSVPEITRYEVRRELFRTKSVGGLNRLDHLHPGLSFLPIADPVMDIASELWAQVRRLGRPTAGDEALDGDAILAATALVAKETADEVIVATTNVAHLARFPGVDARDWWTIA